MRLDRFSNAGYQRGAPRLKEAAWLVVSGLLVESWLPGSHWRVALLRLFGASMGRGIVIKPGVKVKFPWRLRVGHHSWIGERAWIDNLGDVTIGSNVCISQGAFLCTGSHDWSRASFDLIVAPITVADHAWICAYAVLAPGTSVGEGAVLVMGQIGTGQLADWTIHKSGRAAHRVIDR